MENLELGQFKITAESLHSSSGEVISLPKYHFKFKEWNKPHLLVAILERPQNSKN
jgi:hypothetical protein